jgi:hypothetical protein
VLAVVPVEGLAETLRVHGAFRRHLSVGVYTRSVRRWARDAAAVASLGASVVTFNESVAPTGHPAVSIAGGGESGWGATRGEAGLLEWTRPVSVCSTAGWTPDATPPHGDALRWLDRMVRWMNGCLAGARVVSRGGTMRTNLQTPCGTTDGRRRHG